MIQKKPEDMMPSPKPYCEECQNKIDYMFQLEEANQKMEQEIITLRSELKKNQNLTGHPNEWGCEAREKLAVARGALHELQIEISEILEKTAQPQSCRNSVVLCGSCLKEEAIIPKPGSLCRSCIDEDAASRPRPVNIQIKHGGQMIDHDKSCQCNECCYDSPCVECGKTPCYFLWAGQALCSTDCTREYSKRGPDEYDASNGYTDLPGDFLKE